MTLETDADYAQYLDNLARWDWIYAAPGYRVLHAPVEYTVNVGEWCYDNVTVACGHTWDTAYIPGIFSRMGLKRCSRCCDRMGYPRGKGSPKNDDECRRILGLSKSGR